MVLVPASEFLMGSPADQGKPRDEVPRHPVFLDAYWIDRDYVTRWAYERFVAEAPASLYAKDIRELSGILRRLR